MVRTATAIIAALMLSACATNEATPSAGPSSGKVSLQSPPYLGDATAGAPPAPAAQAEVTAPLAAVASQFDPGKQHFVWVLPPGIHGEAPWDLKAIVTLRGEPKFETSLPLKAELATPGSRPEYLAGHEIVRLTDDGRWAERTAEIDKVIQALVAEHGRGHGALEMTSDLNVRIDPAQRQAYCVGNKPAEIRLYLEEDGKPDLIRLDVAAMAGIIQMAVRQACDD